jgi:preprotein translocase subunit SecF
MALLKLVSHNLKIDFVGYRFITFLIAVIISVGTIGTMMVKGINYGIDFEGGYIVEVRTPEKMDVTELREKLNQLNLGEASIQNFGGERDLLIRVERKTEEGASEEAAQEKAISAIKSVIGENADYRRIETVGPKVGSELISNSLKAVGFALLAMLLYIAIRFEWQFAICGIVALAHDTIAVLGIFSVLPFEFNETAIIAILITAGYSMNDTIVIFDRIRENIRKYRKMELAELINKSVNETLSRTILTASTTLIALLALYFWGGKVISSFSLPIIIGILVGSFSSICLAAPLLLYLNIKRGEEVQTREKIPSN